MKYPKIFAAVACLVLLGSGCASTPEVPEVTRKLAPGDKINQVWTVDRVADIEGEEATGKYAALLKGPAQFTGRYTYAMNAALGGRVFTFRPSAEDAKKTPTGAHDIMLANTDDVLAALGIAGNADASGTMTIIIDDLAFEATDPSAENSATFVSLVSKSE